VAAVRPKKFAWYYDSIIDWMVANPGRPLSECAAHVHKSQSWLSTIINSDMFKAALAQRRETFSATHDALLTEKVTKVAMMGMDIILEKMEKKRDAIPISQLHTISDGAMQRLGYGVKPGVGPGVQVNVGVGIQNQPQVVVPVSADDLAAARFALRQAEQMKALPAPSGVEVLGPEPKASEEEEFHAPIPLSA